MSLKRIFYLCMSRNCSTFAATLKKDQAGALFQVGWCVPQSTKLGALFQVGRGVQKRTKLGGSCWIVINIFIFRYEYEM